MVIVIARDNGEDASARCLGCAFDDFPLLRMDAVYGILGVQSNIPRDKENAVNGKRAK